MKTDIRMARPLPHRFAPTPQTLSRFGRTRQWLLLVLIGLAIATTYQLYRQQTHYQLRTFSTPAGWGYAVLNNGTTLIYQPTVPGCSGSAGFVSEAQAQLVGERVIQKLTQNQTWPTLTTDELRQMGVTIP